MMIAMFAGQRIHVDDDGYLTDYGEWDERLARELAARVGVRLTDAHWKPIRFLRADFPRRGETAGLRQVSKLTGMPINDLSVLFGRAAAKTMAYIAGLPKPRRYL